MTNGSQNGKTLYDLLYFSFRHSGVWKILSAILLVFLSGWLLSHHTAQPGTKVIVWGIFEYTKKVAPADPPERAAQAPLRDDARRGDTVASNSPSGALMLAKRFGSKECYYLGRIVESGDQESYFDFESFDYQVWLPNDDIVAVSRITGTTRIATDTKVLVRNDTDTNIWAPGTVLGQQNNTYRVTFDRSASKDCRINRERAVVSRDQILVR